MFIPREYENEYDMNQLIKANIILSFFSLFGSLCIIFLYIFNQTLRSFVFTLVFYLAISESLNSTGNLFSFHLLNEQEDLRSTRDYHILYGASGLYYQL